MDVENSDRKRQVDGPSREEKGERQELGDIWVAIDQGQCESYTPEEFFAKLRKW